MSRKMRVYSQTVIPSATWAQTKSQVIDLDGLGVGIIERLVLQVNYTNATTGAKTFTSGLIEVDNFLFSTKASTNDGDYLVVYDYTGTAWAIACDTTGGQANTPTGAAWAAIPSSHKVYYDFSGQTTAANMATRAVTGLNTLTGFSAAITASTNSGNLICTDAFAGVVTAPTAYTKTGAAGTGSITASVTTAGTASKVNPINNTVSITAHGQATGSLGQMTTSSALPTGLSTSTNYYIIVIDANTIKFASSLANAVAGTAITLTSSGVGTQTFTPTTSSSNVIKAQASSDNVNWVDITSSIDANYPSATVTASTATNAAVMWQLRDPAFQFINIQYNPTAGQITFGVFLDAIGTT